MEHRESDQGETPPVVGGRLPVGAVDSDPRDVPSDSNAAGPAPVVTRVEGGIVIQGTFPDEAVLEIIRAEAGPLPLIIADPPYGNVVSDAWDRIDTNQRQFAEWMYAWTRVCAALSAPNAALYVWAGIGIPGFRPFYTYAANLEGETPYTLANHITWSKKRAYGIQHNYLFTREELLYLVNGSEPKKPRTFHVPLLDEKRGYAGYNKAYPAKSEFKRRTNVWTDVTEIFRGKIHVAQKPERLHEILIETHTEPGEWVLDPFGGSGTTARAAKKLGRKFILVENDPASIRLILDHLEPLA